MSGSGDNFSTEGLGNSTERATGCINPFDDRIYTIVAALAAASGFISLLASCFVIFLFKKWRFYTQRLILYLAITATLLSLSYIIQRTDYDNQKGVHYDNFCILAGFLSQVTGWMVLNAIVCIMMSLLLTAFSNKRAEKYEPLFLFLIFAFPLTFNWIPFIKLAYGKAGAWCWIRSTDDMCQKFEFGQTLQLVLWYIPLYVVMFILIILYIVVLVKLHRTKRKWTGTIDPYAKKIQEQISKEILPLLAYPLVFFLLSILPFINRIHGAADPNNPEPVLWVISGALFPLQGGVIAIAFSLDPETRKRLTLANFKAAFINFRRTSAVQEYNMGGSEELEKSPTGVIPEKSLSKEKEAELEFTKQ